MLFAFDDFERMFAIFFILDIGDIDELGFE